jgi:polysaccharide biosynthesis protein PslA
MAAKPLFSVVPPLSSIPSGDDATARHIVERIEAAERHCKGRKKTRVLISISLMASDFIALIVGFTSANIVVYGFDDLPQIGTVLAASLPLMLMFGLHDSAYSSRVGINAPRSIYRGLKSFLFLAAALMLLAFLFKIGADFSRAQFLVGTLLSVVLMTVFRWGVANYNVIPASRGLFADLHIYDGDHEPKDGGLFVLNAAQAGLVPNRSDSRMMSRLGMFAKGMDSVVVHCAPDVRESWAQALKTLDVPTEIVVPELDQLRPLAITARDGHASILLSDGRLTWEQEVLKRLFDLALVIPMLPLLLPIFLVVAVAIKLDSPGPVFFRQNRIGIGNRSFRIWKFRSMQFSQQDSGASKLTQRDDPRVTRVGAFIRRTSIDELPQLLNVLTGDMSLVGPRPHAPLAKAGSLLYWEVDETYWERHVVKPGITGLAQVRGFRGNTFIESNLRDRLQADLEYVAKWSLILDVKILATTIVMPFSGNAF